MLLAGKDLEGVGLCRLILQRLHLWLEGLGGRCCEEAYMAMPFGSRIILDDIRPRVDHIPIYLTPNHDVESQWLSVRRLQAMWQLPECQWPPILDHADLQLIAQVHEAISFVHVRDSPEHTEVLAFKSVSSDVKYMYHELKTLLTMKPHRHVVSPPLYVVTKKCRFGGRSAVCGFIMKVLPHGTLRDVLGTTKTGSPPPSLNDRLQWTKQILSALKHIRSTPARFYTDLKPNNIMFRDTDGAKEIVLIDFEQRGSWFSWSPPEVYYVEYLELLVSSGECSGQDCENYYNLLTQYMKDWKPRTRNNRYVDSTYGFSQAWGSLTRDEAEAAQVFMVGRLLWCIFEGIPFPNSCATVEIFREEQSDQSFPEFRLTPDPLRECIRRCTSGSPEWAGRLPSVVRSGDKLFPRGRTGRNGEPAGSSLETQESAREWWRQEINAAQRFLAARIRQRQGFASKQDDQITAFMFQRPSLENVESVIAQLSEGAS
jgi:hypothetical protein